MVSKKAKERWKNTWRGKRSSLPTDNIGRLDLKVGIVREVIYHPRASHKYFITAVNFGELFSSVVGCALVHHYQPDELMDRLVVCCCNIKPAWVKESDFYTSMLVAASSDQSAKLELLIPPDGAKPGDIITVVGHPRDPERPFLDPKETSFEEIAEKTKINDRGQVLFDSHPWVLEKNPSLGHVHVVKAFNSYLRIV